MGITEETWADLVACRDEHAAVLGELKPKHLPHYHRSPKYENAVYFYGGPFSNFAAGPNLAIRDKQPWAPGSYADAYATTEHFFAASKAAKREHHIWVNEAFSPGQAKTRGRSVDLRKDWEEREHEGLPPTKFMVMVTALRAKADQWPLFAKALAETGDAYIAEDSPDDTIWGLRDGKGGFTGLNYLGLALMLVREEILIR